MAGVLAALGDDGRRFAFTISADDVALTKPDPMPYTEAASRFGVPAGRLVVFEDSPTGIRSAVGSGALVFAVPHTGGAQVAGGVRVLHSLTEASYDVIRVAVSESGVPSR